MPSYKSVWSSVAYHSVTAPAIRAAKNLIKRGAGEIKKRVDLHRGVGHGLNPARKARVRALTRGPAGATPRLFSKGTISGQKRRLAAAVAARKIPRPVRTHNAPRSAAVSPKITPKVSPKPPARPVAKVATKAAPAPTRPVQAPKPSGKLVRRKPPGSVREAMAGSRDKAHLRRKLIGLSVRKAGEHQFPGASRTQRAQGLRLIRSMQKTRQGRQSKGLTPVGTAFKDKALRRTVSILNRKKK